MSGKNKVLLFNSDGVKIGDTYYRRAAQLVRQQKAEWSSEALDAVRFYKGMENGEASDPDVNAAVPLSDEANITKQDSHLGISPHINGLLRNEFEKRVREREKFIIHTFALIPVSFGILVFHIILSEFVFRFMPWRFQDAVTFLGIGMVGIWVLIYFIHLFLYLTNKSARLRIARGVITEAALQGKI